MLVGEFNFDRFIGLEISDCLLIQVLSETLVYIRILKKTNNNDRIRKVIHNVETEEFA